MLTGDELKEIEERYNAVQNNITGWSSIKIEEEDGIDGEPYTHIYIHQGSILGETLIMMGDTYEGHGEDGNFLGHAYEDVGKLLEEVKKLDIKGLKKDISILYDYLHSGDNSRLVNYDVALNIVNRLKKQFT